MEEFEGGRRCEGDDGESVRVHVHVHVPLGRALEIVFFGLLDITPNKLFPIFQDIITYTIDILNLYDLIRHFSSKKLYKKYLKNLFLYLLRLYYWDFS